jgi:arylsulfatase
VDIAGAQYPKEYDHNEITPMQGVSLLPAFEGKALPDRVIYWEHEGNRAVRQGDWKLVATGPSGAWELYNMLTDRSEMHDLASSEPDKARTMAEMWETWAKQAHVLPWPWTPQYGQPPEADTSPAHVTLKLKADADLAKKKAPPIVGRAITIRAAIEQPATDGVIVSHGGTATGYAFYMKDGRLCFATRHDDVLSVVESREPIGQAVKSLGVTMSKDGSVTLTADDKEVGTGKVPGPVRTKPKDGLQVGRDNNAPVGDYTSPFPFKGQLGEVTVELSKE